MKICKNCNAEMKDDDVYCMYCGTKADDAPVDTVDPSKIDPFAPDPATDTAPPQSSAAAAKNVGIVEKAKAFESKHNVILNTILIVCAIVVLFVSLFAPIKVVDYRTGMHETDGKEITVNHVETGQTIFQIIGSVFYIDADEDKLNELSKQYAKCRNEYDKEYAKWLRQHPYATSQERVNAQRRISAECLSELNVIGNMFAQTDPEDMFEGESLAVLVTAIIAIVIAALCIATAITSLVYIIKAVLNIVKKRPQTKLYKYLSTVLGLSLSCITLMCCAPMLVAGGNMLGVAVFTVIAYFIIATAGAVIGKVNIAVIIKRAAIAVVSAIAFFILCTNVLAWKNVYEEYTYTYNMQSGSGFYNIVRALGGGEGSDNDFISAIVPFVMCVIIALLFVPYVGSVMHRSLTRLAYGNVKRSSVTALAIAAAVFALVAIVLGFLSNTITEQLFELYDAPITEVDSQWLVRAQVWVSMFFMIAVAVFNKVFLPNDVKKNAELRMQNAE